jgi:hypothetical protein
MSLVGWSRKFEHYQAVTDVPERVRKTEICYWCWLAVSILVLLAGIGMLARSGQSQVGLLLAVCGVVDIALIKLWAHIRLATYQIIMELQVRDKGSR